MHDTTWLLERAGERFDMGEPALDRLVRRRDRKERNRRLATAGTALAISVGGVGVALAALRTSGSAVPASGGTEASAAADGGSLASLVLPSAAIWAAIGALAVVLLALGRLRERPAGPAPPATSPDGPREALATVGVDPRADKVKTRYLGRREGTMATHVERYPERHAARNVWVTVGVLALLALAIGTGVLIGRATVEETAPTPEPLGLAPAAVVATLDANIAATVGADPTALEATFAPEGVFTDEIAGTEIVGAQEIAANYADGSLTTLERTSEVVMIGDYAANAFRWATSGSSGEGIAVFQFDDAGLIVHQWVIGD